MTLYFSVMDAPVGPLRLIVDDEGSVVSIEFPGGRSRERLEREALSDGLVADDERTAEEVRRTDVAAPFNRLLRSEGVLVRVEGAEATEVAFAMDRFLEQAAGAALVVDGKAETPAELVAALKELGEHPDGGCTPRVEDHRRLAPFAPRDLTALATRQQAGTPGGVADTDHRAFGVAEVPDQLGRHERSLPRLFVGAIDHVDDRPAGAFAVDRRLGQTPPFECGQRGCR